MKEIEDTGFWRLRANPICKAGVFDYLGGQIDLDGTMGLEKLRRYKVYRPAPELFDRAAIESFEGKPFVVGHQLLGDDADCVPVEKVPAHGTIIHVRESSDTPGVLIADILIYTRTMKNLIEGGTKGLSLGYLCDFVPEAGVHDGQAYEFVQKGIQGNHLALVERPRNGTYVQDSADGGGGAGEGRVYAIGDDAGRVACASRAFAIDSAIEETQPMKTDKGDKPETPEETLSALLTGQDAEACKATIEFLRDYLEKREKAKSGGRTPTGDGNTDGDSTPQPPPKKDDEGKGDDDDSGDGNPANGDGGESTPPPNNDGNPDNADGGAATPPAKPAEDCGGDCGKGGENGKDDGDCPPNPKGGKTPACDEAVRKELFRQFSRANDLKTRVSPLVGAFDSADMTEEEVAAYSCRKLGLAFDEAIPATAVYAINARLSATPAPDGGTAARAAKTPTFDSAENAKTVESLTRKCEAEYFGDNQ